MIRIIFWTINRSEWLIFALAASEP